jgi:cbb3-type cytochrome oxidase maturation protein
MIDYFYLIPLALAIGGVALGAFMWSLRSGQYEDLDGAAARILFDDTAPGDPAPRLARDPTAPAVPDEDRAGYAIPAGKNEA